MNRCNSFAALLALTSALTSSALLAMGCGGESGDSTLTCGTGTSAALAVAGPALTVASAGKALAGASIQAPAKTNVPAMPVSISCASADIVPTDWIALSPAVTFGPEGFASGERLWELQLPFKAARMPSGAHFSAVHMFVKRKGPAAAVSVAVPNLHFDDKDRFQSMASFRAAELATYQLAIRADAGTPKQRRYTNRALVGISMGGGGTAGIGMRNPDKFDVLAPLVAEPGMDIQYFLKMIAEIRFGGFCTAADEAASAGAKRIGMLCDPRPVMVDQHETVSTWEHFLYQKGDGVGLTLNRGLYLKGTRDFSRAYSNLVAWNKDDPYLPPGVPPEYILRPVAERCGTPGTPGTPPSPIVLKRFFDRNFNPAGDKDVITFCDGGDSQALGLGVWDVSLPQNDPAETFLAVDLNANGIRDPGEPVILQQGEPWQDLGADGIASKDEPGYDPNSNPDPAGDDFHYLKNPIGTEGDYRWQTGEPYQDSGIDGVMGQGCEQGSGPQCWDHGEGDGKLTRTPNVERWLARDPKTLWAALTPTQQARLDLYMDAGIRDFLNSAPAANSFMAGLVAAGGDGRIYDDFKSMVIDPVQGTTDIKNFDFTRLGKHIHVRYGNPDATQQQQELGDGRHVGTGPQIVNRVIAAFAFISSRYPQGDRLSYRTTAENFKRGLSFRSNASGRETPYSLFVPPGYDLPENASKRYPVVYFFHGYGMQPEDLVDLSSVFSNFMVSPQIPEEKRFTKFIIVYVDGSCRPGGTLPVTTGDQCERGTFYTDSPRNTTAKMESDLFQLMAYVDQMYRTKGEETISVIE